jgi:hypothetical protein
MTQPANSILKWVSGVMGVWGQGEFNYEVQRV